MNTADNNSKRSMIAGSLGLLSILFLLSFLSADPVLQMLGLSQLNASLLFASRLLYWLCILLLWWFTNKFEKQGLLLYKDTPYRPSQYFLFIVIVLIILFVGALIINLILSAAGLSEKSTKLLELVHIFRNNKWLLIFTSLTAGVTEELMFRGYLQTRFEKIFSNQWVAIVLSSLLFGLLHFRYGTVKNVAGPFFIGFIFALYYRKYRNIKVLMICHFIWDLLVLYLLLNTTNYK